MSKLQTWATKKVIALKTRKEEGQGLVEYGLILALIAAVCIGALAAIGTDINSLLGTLSGAFGGA